MPKRNVIVELVILKFESSASIAEINFYETFIK
jgi:hypothetical protein